MRHPFHRLIVATACVAALAGCGMQSGGGLKSVASDVRAHEAKATAVDAYIYGYPLVTMELTRRIMTNVAAPTGKLAPMGQIAKLRAYPSPDDKEVTAPNADTLYTLAWVDVAKEPWILSVPDMKGRYFLLPLLDGWTNVFQVPGKRTTGTKAQKYAITGPGWQGKLPAGVTEYKSPTAMVWLLGRIYCTGTPEDYAAVHAAQDAISLVPLSSYGKPYTPPPGVVDAKIDGKTPTRDQVNALDGIAYFTLLAELMKTNPPAAADAAAVAKFAAIGLVPGKSFDASKLDASVVAGIQAAPKTAQEKIPAWTKEGILLGDNKIEDGWLYTIHAGEYGTNYRQRAFITWIGLGANRPQDAIYPTSEGPDVLAKYDGNKKYVLHFAKGELPPVNAFWSLTMYDEKYFFVPNTLHRATLSQRDKLVKNADGSVDLYIQHESPGKTKEANWLPAPTGRFVLMMRLYWPKPTKPSILDGTWKIPRVREAS